MTPRRKRRLIVVLFVLCGISIATFLGLRAFQANIEFFLTPKQFAANDFELGQRYRVAGLVKNGSVATLADGVTHSFIITDCENDIGIEYRGSLPDLFREGQAIIALGSTEKGEKLTADQVLAKHDENYVPSEAAEIMMESQRSKCDVESGAITL